MTDMLALLQGLARPRVLVVGDLILDRYVWGDVSRISPEAPVIILRADREELRPGGAASVAALLRALEATVAVAGVVGADAAAGALRELLSEQRVDHRAVLTDPSRPTTTKDRLMGRAAHRHPVQMFRVDREETHALPPAVEHSLLDRVLGMVADQDVVLVSDYAKGVLAPGTLAQLIERCRSQGVPVLVDPARCVDCDRYRGATLLTPNRVEAEMATGHTIRGPDDAVIAASALLARLDGTGADAKPRRRRSAVLVKLDRDGMVLAVAGEPPVHFPTRPRDVYDVTGAGDLVLVMMGVCCASGMEWAEAVPLANLAAGLEVERLGVSPVTREELHIACFTAANRKHVSADEMATLVAAYRRQGKTIVFTNGCFDLLHVGHANYLRDAAELGDVLIVAVNSDRSVQRLKGPARPVICDADRVAMLAALACVHHVLVFDEDTPEPLLLRLRPNVLVKGGTYAPAEIVGRDIVEAYGGRVCVVAETAGVSTTQILAAVSGQPRPVEECN